ncbi:MAG: heavy metal-binding domain-containing protein [Ferruginibacter sp.]
MKTIIMAFAILLASTATFAQAKKTVQKHNHSHSTAATKYTCTMHPEVVKSKPGKCPKCGMALVKTKPVKKSNMKADMKM